MALSSLAARVHLIHDALHKYHQTHFTPGPLPASSFGQVIMTIGYPKAIFISGQI